MQVLQLCHRIPYPPVDGGSIAMHQITGGLMLKGAAVKVFALSPVALENNLAAIDGDYRSKTGFEAVSVDTRVRIIPALANLFTTKPYNIQRYRSKRVDAALKKILSENRFDIIQLEGLYLTPYIPLIRSLSGAPVLYRSHNIEHFIWKRLATTEKNPVKKAYLRMLSSRLQKYETEIIHDVDGLVAISEVDRQFFHSNGYTGPSIVIPAGMPDIAFPDQRPAAEQRSVFHLGSMDWRPNQEGVTWFLKKVWPLVTRKDPDLLLYLAGRRMPHYYHQFASDRVKVVGEVDNAIAFILSKNIMVVPLLSGGGMRVKIIEGMAAGKTIISTSIGAEGIGCEHKKNILLADKPEDMAAWITECTQNTAFSEKISKQAQEFAAQHYNLNRIISDLLVFYQRFYSK